MLRQATELVLPLVVARALNGDVEAQKLVLERGLPKLKPVELPIEFSLEDGETAPARAVLLQAAAGELPLSHAEKLMDTLLPMIQQEEKAIARKALTYGNAYLDSVTARVNSI